MSDEKTGCISKRVPPEVFEDIFLFACVCPRWKASDAFRHGYDKPLTKAEGYIDRQTRHSITSTCRYWRNISLDSRALWSCIVVNVQDPRDHDPEWMTDPDSVYMYTPLTPPLPYILLELTRSGYHPLDMTLILQRPFDWVGCEEVRDPLRAALPQCRSLRIFDRGSSRIGGNGVLSFICPSKFEHVQSGHDISEASYEPESFPSLKMLDVRFHDESDEERHTIDISGAPLLEYVSISGNQLFSNLKTNNLSHVSMEICGAKDVENVVKTLRGCGGTLEMLKIYDDSDDEPSNIPIPSISLPSLTHLSFLRFRGNATTPSPILMALSNTKLQYLKVDSWYPSLRPLTMSRSLIDTLQSLTITSHISKDHFIEDLHVLTNLRELILPRDYDISEHVSRALLQSKEGQEDAVDTFVLLPRLEILGGSFWIVELAEKLLSERNGLDRTESPGMPFMLQIWPTSYRLSKEARSFQILRERHPYSVQVANSYDPISEPPFDADAW